MLTIYRREGCHLCDDAEILLRDELAVRARAGHAKPAIERVDVSSDAELEERYGHRIPVFAVGEMESDLVTNGGQLRAFLDRALNGPAA